MVKEYKMSKYTFRCFDDVGNLLLINFMVGANSLSIIDKDQVCDFEANMLNKNSIVANSTNTHAIEQLLKAGIIVRFDLDEDAVYDAKFYEKIYSNTWQIVILPTHRCNFKCKYCYENSEFSSIPDMDLDEQKCILKYIQKNAGLYSKLRVSWFGGEPLLAIKTIQFLSEGIICICNKRGIRYESEITTNAYNLSPELFDMLYNNKIYIYQITLDGTKNEHDMQRVRIDGTGTFDRIFENLLYIRNNPQKYKFARITIRTNVTRNIVQNLENYLDLYDTYFGADERFSVRFIEAYNYDQLMGNVSDRLLSTDYIERTEFLDLVYSARNRERITKKDDIINMFTPMKSICYAASKKKFVIDTNLKVYKCTVHFENQDNCIGYINRNGDMVLDESLNSRWYVRSAVSERCKKCFYLPCCNRTGCPLKYNMCSDCVSGECRIEELEKKIAINMQRLKEYITPILIEMGK